MSHHSDQLTVDIKRGKNNPVSIIRRNMLIEIVILLLGAIIFLGVPLRYELSEKAEAIYMISMFISVLMLLACALRFMFFLKKTPPLTKNTVHSIQTFIFDAKMTLEVYKSFSISASLLIPVPVFALVVGNVNSALYNPERFEKWLFLNLSTIETIGLVGGYLLCITTLYFTTIWWTNYMYGKHLKNTSSHIRESIRIICWNIKPTLSHSISFFLVSQLVVVNQVYYQLTLHLSYSSDWF